MNLHWLIGCSILISSFCTVSLLHGKSSDFQSKESHSKSSKPLLTFKTDTAIVREFAKSLETRSNLIAAVTTPGESRGKSLHALFDNKMEIEKIDEWLHSRSAQEWSRLPQDTLHIQTKTEFELLLRDKEVEKIAAFLSVYRFTLDVVPEPKLLQSELLQMTRQIIEHEDHDVRETKAQFLALLSHKSFRGKNGQTVFTDEFEKIKNDLEMLTE